MSTARPPQGAQDRSAQREGTPVRIGGALLRHLGALCLALSMALPAGCGAAPPAEEQVGAPDTDDAAAPRELFVFFDGTRNDPSSATILCPPVLDHMTRTDEQWFAGAHSDVGGGYAASTMHLASLNWMAELLRPHLGAEIAAFPEAGSEQPAHWSMADAPGNLGSECIDRPLPDGATLHPSAQTYRRAANAPLRIKGKKVDSPNPPSCVNVGAR